MKKYWTVLPLVALTACGASEKLCEYSVNQEIRALEFHASYAEDNLKNGYARVDPTPVRRSVNMAAVNTDPDLRTAPCTGLDLDGNERQYMCFYDLQQNGGKAIPIDASLERKIATGARRLAAEKRASRASNIAACLASNYKFETITIDSF